MTAYTFLAAHAALIPGLSLPLWTAKASLNGIIPRVGEAPSLLGFIRDLYVDGYCWAAVGLFLWCVVLPVVKLVMVVLVERQGRLRWRTRARLLDFLQKVSKWSALDFFFAATVVSFAVTQSMVDIQLRAGALCHLAYSVLSTVGLLLLKPPEHEPESREELWHQTSAPALFCDLGARSAALIVLVGLLCRPALQLSPNLFLDKVNLSVFSLTHQLFCFASCAQMLAGMAVVLFTQVLPAVHAVGTVAGYWTGGAVLGQVGARWVRCLAMLDVLAVSMLLASKAMAWAIPELVHVEVLPAEWALLWLASLSVVEALLLDGFSATAEGSEFAKQEKRADAISV